MDGHPAGFAVVTGLFVGDLDQAGEAVLAVARHRIRSAAGPGQKSKRGLNGFWTFSA